jgi:hypothetical protein
MNKTLGIIVGIAVIVGLVMYFSGSNDELSPKRENKESSEKVAQKPTKSGETIDIVVPSAFKNAENVNDIELMFGINGK